MTTTTTIQITRNVKAMLDATKLYGRETYNELITRLIEDSKELGEETKKEIKKARAEISAGRFKTHEELGHEMGFK